MPATDSIGLDQQQLEHFTTEGYLRLGRVLDQVECRALLAEEARFRPSHPYGGAGTSDALFVRDQLCHHSAPVRRFCLEGRHVSALAQLLGPDVAFTHTQFIAKAPAPDDDASVIPLHQDDGYGTLDPPVDVTVWTAITDTDEENGCLVIAPRSHVDGVLTHAVAATNPSLRDGGRPDLETVAVPLAAGEAVAFSGLTLHGSGPNRSQAVRVGMHARYCLPWARMLTDDAKPVLHDANSWMVLGEAPLDGWHSANDKFRDGSVGATS